MISFLSEEQYHKKYYKSDCLKIDKVKQVFEKYDLELYDNIVEGICGDVLINGVFTYINGVKLSVIVGKGTYCDYDNNDSYEVWDYYDKEPKGNRNLSFIENRIKWKLGLFEKGE